MFDPLKTSETTRAIVCDNDQRKYFRFRPARFYGGIATADCVGCNLRCAFCWSWNVTTRPEVCGTFYKPQDVAKRLIAIAMQKKFKRLRISGNEPTICREHLMKVLELIPKGYLFIIETNGILIGSSCCPSSSPDEERVEMRGGWSVNIPTILFVRISLSW